MANETGGLILIHYHNNKELLDLLTDVNGKLYYKGKAVFPIDNPDLLNLLSDKNGELQYKSKPVMYPVKNDAKNAIQVTGARELFVDNSFFLTKAQYDVLSKFQYGAYILTFDGQEVSMKADDNQVRSMIDYVWETIDKDSEYDWLKDGQDKEEKS